MNVRLEDSKVSVTFDRQQCSIEAEIETSAYANGNPELVNMKISGPRNALVTIHDYKINNPIDESERMDILVEQLKDLDSILLMSYDKGKASGVGPHAPECRIWVPDMAVNVVANIAIVDSDGGETGMCESALDGQEKPVAFIYGKISNVFRLDGKIVFSMEIHGADWNTWTYAALQK
jgi:hypothetical protein